MQYLHNVIGLQPRVGRGVDEHIGEGVLVVIHLVCGGDRARRAVTPQPLLTSAPPGPVNLRNMSLYPGEQLSVAPLLLLLLLLSHFSRVRLFTTP